MLWKVNITRRKANVTNAGVNMSVLRRSAGMENASSILRSRNKSASLPLPPLRLRHLLPPNHWPRHPLQANRTASHATLTTIVRRENAQTASVVQTIRSDTVLKMNVQAARKVANARVANVGIASVQMGATIASSGVDTRESVVNAARVANAQRRYVRNESVFIIPIRVTANVLATTTTETLKLNGSRHVPASADSNISPIQWSSNITV